MKYLRQRIKNACAEITPDVTKSATENIYIRLGIWQNVKGEHFEHKLHFFILRLLAQPSLAGSFACIHWPKSLALRSLAWPSGPSSCLHFSLPILVGLLLTFTSRTFSLPSLAGSSPCFHWPDTLLAFTDWSIGY